MIKNTLTKKIQNYRAALKIVVCWPLYIHCAVVVFTRLYIRSTRQIQSVRDALPWLYYGMMSKREVLIRRFNGKSWNRCSK